jgi:hypothetical protein
MCTNAVHLSTQTLTSPALHSPPHRLFSGQSQPVPAVLFERQKLMHSAMHALSGEGTLSFSHLTKHAWPCVSAFVAQTELPAQAVNGRHPWFTVVAQPLLLKVQVYLCLELNNTPPPPPRNLPLPSPPATHTTAPPECMHGIVHQLLVAQAKLQTQTVNGRQPCLTSPKHRQEGWSGPAGGGEKGEWSMQSSKNKQKTKK